MSSILLVRHGQASFGEENYDTLSALGMIQAKLLGQHYAKLNRPITQIMSGTLARQIDSAKLFCHAYQANYNCNYSDESEVNASLNLATIQMLEKVSKSTDCMHTTEAFNEFFHEDIFVKFDPKFADRNYLKALIAKAPNPDQYLAELFNQAMLRWYANEHAEDYLESWQVFDKRIHDGLNMAVKKLIGLRDTSDKANTPKQDYSMDQAIKRGRVGSNLSKPTDPTLMIFTSGGVIATLTARLLGGDSLLAYQLNQSLVNCGVTTLTVDADNKVSLRAFNEHSHLLADGVNRLTRR